MVGSLDRVRPAAVLLDIVDELIDTIGRLHQLGLDPVGS